MTPAEWDRRYWEADLRQALYGRRVSKMLWIFGNDDDPDPPTDYWPNSPQWLRYLAWYVRNPLHNFSAYVIGVQGRQFRFVASRPNSIDSAFADGGGWLFAYIAYKWLRLPYISYSGRFQFYWGWTPRGSFGLRLTGF